MGITFRQIADFRHIQIFYAPYLVIDFIEVLQLMVPTFRMKADKANK